MLSSFNEGRAIFASGRPFDPWEYDGIFFVPGQAINAYISLGLATSGALARGYRVYAIYRIMLLILILLRVEADLAVACSRGIPTQIVTPDLFTCLLPLFTSVLNNKI
ncbi:hypothetical protein MKW98_003120, partial [Papaver atlanticum]